jgi:hypothetical protein
MLSAALVMIASAASAADTLSATELASRLSALRQNGDSYVRLRMEIKGAKQETLQVQIKQRWTKSSSEVVYQVLFPKERKGESILLKRAGNRSATGSTYIPPNTVHAINDTKEPLFGSDLSYEDVIDNFYAWEQQAIVGTEVVEGVSCQILESKPGKSDHSSYASVRSWIDIKRLVPMRIEKYSGPGHVLRRIDTTRVVVDAGHPIPADLAVRGPRQDSSTLLDGSRIKHDVSYTDADFSMEGFKELTIPRGAPE